MYITSSKTEQEYLDSNLQFEVKNKVLKSLNIVSTIIDKKTQEYIDAKKTKNKRDFTDLSFKLGSRVSSGRIKAKGLVICVDVFCNSTGANLGRYAIPEVDFIDGVLSENGAHELEHHLILDGCISRRFLNLNLAS